MNNKPKRGRPTEAPLTERVYARVTDEEKERYLALGGSEWLRKQLPAAPDQGEVQRLWEAVSALADIAHEHRHELMQQRFSDNDEGDAFARHRDSRVGRIDRILQAALAASTGQEVGK